jgi:potassium-transporting ATPase KdpC subunit
MAFLRQAGVAVRFLVVMTIVLGVIYPFAVFAVGRLTAAKADGSFVTDASGQVVGSSLIGQSFDGPTWFHSRPSAAGDGYDALSSSGSNLGPDNPDLVDAVTTAKTQAARRNGVAPDQVPPDAVTSSGSGLDPHISPQYAQIQINRVARARGLSPDQVAALVQQYTEDRWLGFLGEPRVNVLQLNLALAASG